MAWMVYDYPEMTAAQEREYWGDEEDDDVFDYEPYEYASEET